MYNEIVQGHWQNPDPHLCGCGGSGWLYSDLDTYHWCPYHGVGVMPPEGGSDRAFTADYNKNPWLYEAIHTVNQLRALMRDDNVVSSPNGCGPDYAIEHDLDRFIAFGFLASYNNLFGPGTESMHPQPNDLHWLRRNFLEAVNFAAEWLEKCKPPLASLYHGDQPDSGVSFPVDGHDYMELHWEIVGYDRDNAVSFVLRTNIDMGDLLCVWVAANSLKDKTTLMTATAKAQAVLNSELPEDSPPEEVECDDGKTVQQIVDEEYERHHPWSSGG